MQAWINRPLLWLPTSHLVEDSPRSSSASRISRLWPTIGRAHPRPGSCARGLLFLSLPLSPRRGPSLVVSIINRLIRSSTMLRYHVNSHRHHQRIELLVDVVATTTTAEVMMVVTSM